jgi:toxin ParE1/3/4
VRITWTTEALDDLENILAYYYEQSWPAIAEAIEARIVLAIEKLRDFPERIRASDRILGARELVIHRLPYIAFVRVTEDEIQVLNIVHTMRKFP